MVEHGADEGWELGVLFAFASLWINGRLGVWVFAMGVGQLSLITTAEILEQCTGFFQSVVVGDLIVTAFEELLLGWSVGLGCLQDLGCAAACLAPKVVIGKFCTCFRALFEITRILDSIRFLFAFVNDTTIDSEFFLTVDNVATLAESAVDLGNRVVEGNLCHGFVKLKGFKSVRRKRLLFSERGKAATV